MNIEKILTPEQIEEFHRCGVLVIKDFYSLQDDILPIQRGIYDIIGQVMVRHNVDDHRKVFSADDFDDAYLELIRINRSWGGEIYDAVKQLPSFYRLLSHSAHEQLFRHLRENSIPAIAGAGHGIRIDNPFEDKFRAMWHQEYPAQLRSIDGLVFWSPLVPVTNELGPVRFCAGSHLAGSLPVHSEDPDQSGRTQAYALKLHNEEKIIGQYTQIAPLTSPGDLVVIDFLTLHASGHNRSTRSRWSMQFRYFNFADATGRTHGWKGSYAAGIDFRTIHPELFID